MKTLFASFLILAAASACGAEEIALIQTKNWRGAEFESRFGADGAFERRMVRDGSGSSEPRVLERRSLSPQNLEHLKKVILHSGVLDLAEDSALDEPAADVRDLRSRLEGSLTVRVGGREKTVRFGPSVHAIPDGVFAVLNEASRLSQEG